MFNLKRIYFSVCEASDRAREPRKSAGAVGGRPAAHCIAFSPSHPRWQAAATLLASGIWTRPSVPGNVEGVKRLAPRMNRSDQQWSILLSLLAPAKHTIGARFFPDDGFSLPMKCRRGWKKMCTPVENRLPSHPPAHWTKQLPSTIANGCHPEEPGDMFSQNMRPFRSLTAHPQRHNPKSNRVRLSASESR